MINKLLAVLLHPFFLTSLGLIILSVLIWWIGPLVAIGSIYPLASELSRGLLIGFFVLLAVLRCALNHWRKRRSAQQLADGMVQSAIVSSAKESRSAADTETQVLGERFSEAVAALRKMRTTASGGKSGWRDFISLSSKDFLYELPWYVFIGGPGSGKTTALINSGLRFPLADKTGVGSVQGVGGTRNCDWWFTDEAVLIDTAGRYTTQDSHQEGDKNAWQGFLGLLKKTRPRRPLNGIFLTVSVPDLLGQGQQERARLADALCARLLEIDEALRTRLPIYVLVTKCDLLHGFTEYFDDLGKDARGQVWGVTLPLGASNKAQPIQELAPHLQSEMALLVQRLNDGLINRMQQESDGIRRSAMFSFPTQFANFTTVLGDFLNEVFVASKFVQSPIVRGVYFTSGTQEGHPIDRIMSGLAHSFGLPRAQTSALARSGKSYFLLRLMREVVFPEQGLAGADLAWQRRSHWLRQASFALMGLVGIGLVTAWTLSYVNNSRYIAHVKDQADKLSGMIAELPAQASGQDGSSALLPLAAALQAVREGWITQDNPGGEAPLSMGWGLYQGDKLDMAATIANQRGLREAFMPRLAIRIEEQLRRADKTNLEYSYEALKAYLMLHDAEHYDAEALKAWIKIDWRSLDRAVDDKQRQILEDQLDALLGKDPVQSPLPKDESLIASVRAMLSSYPLEQRIYSRIRRQGLALSDLPEFTVAKAAGPSAALVFERASGKPLNSGVPVLYTRAGYTQGFNAEVARVTALLAREENWVLGRPAHLANLAQDSLALSGVLNRVRGLYLNDYVKTWDALLADVRLAKTNDLEKSIQIARILSGVDSPLANFLRAVVDEVTLIRPDNEKSLVDKASDKVSSARSELEKILGAPRSQAIGSGKRIESIVDDHFDALRRLVQSPAPNQAAPLDSSLKLFNDVYVYLSAVDVATKSRSALPPATDAVRIKTEAQRLPEPVRSMLENISQSGNHQTRQAELNNLQQDLRPITDFCRQAIAGRYPINASSQRDILLEDFARLFAPAGLMDDFFNKHLAPLVDTSVSPWRFKPTPDAPARNSTALAQFERAAKIREAFFRGGGQAVSFRLDFKPLELDAGITQFSLNVDDQLVKYAHGPVLPMSVQWPGKGGIMQVRLEVTPPSASGSSGMVIDGPWAIFRLFSRHRLESAGTPEKFIVVFSFDGRSARFEVSANSVQNPIRLNALRTFSCPEKL